GLIKEEKFICAARLAAMSVFSNRPLIGEQGTDVAIGRHDATGGSEQHGRGDVPITPSLIASTLKTSLFTSSGRWAHRSYAEFLAAWYLAEREVSWPILRSVIVHPFDISGKLVPQLHEVAAWLS